MNNECTVTVSAMLYLAQAKTFIALYISLDKNTFKTTNHIYSMEIIVFIKLIGFSSRLICDVFVCLNHYFSYYKILNLKLNFLTCFEKSCMKNGNNYNIILCTTYIVKLYQVS